MIIPRRARATPIESPKAVEAPGASTPTEEEHQIVGVSELMLTSLPPMMSGADVYMRQFYRGNRLPFRRYLPLKGV